MTLLRTAACICIIGTTATAAVEPCVVGTWQADLNEIAAIMADQMQGSARPVSGRVMMQIAPAGTVRIDVIDMTLSVKVPNAPEMAVTVTGYSAGAMDASSGTWAANSTDYNLVGAADVLGTRMEIPFTSSTGMFGNGSGSYTCAGSNLNFTTATPPAKIPPNWSRLD